MSNNKSESRGIFNISDRFKNPKRLIIIAILVLLGVIGIGIIYKTIKPTLNGSFGNYRYVLTVRPNETSKYGELTIKVVRIDPASPSVDVLLTYPKGEPMTFKNMKETAIITYPPENGYDITVLRVDAQGAVFGINPSVQ